MFQSTVRGAVAVCSILYLTGLVAAEEIGLPMLDEDADGVVNLLENKLDDWQAEDGREVDNWRMRGKELENFKAGSHLITKKKYRDFDLSLEFKLPRRGNSGVYLRGRYEIQLADGQNLPPNKYTGSVWGQIPVESKMYKGANEWNELQIRVKNNTVSVILNRKPVIRSKSFKGPSRGAIDQNEKAPGPIMLQSLNGVRFRKIYLKEL